MAILPNGVFPAPVNRTAEGGSPRGWTFLSSTECMYRWALRYVVGIVPIALDANLETGSAYHAILEGRPLDEVKASYPDYFDDAQKYAADRVENGPPLVPNASTKVEPTYTIFNGLMTSKPDRVEYVKDDRGEKRGVARDYKTAGTFSESDAENFGANGGILGEIIAVQQYEKGLNYALVDIQRKWESREGKSRKGSNTKIVRVELHAWRRTMLEDYVHTAWAKIEDAIKTQTFPKNLAQCVGKYGPCPYFNRCHNRGTPESTLYTRVAPARRWVVGTKDRKLPTRVPLKLVEKVAKEFKET